jgi:autophagy-related protein 27
VYNTHDNVTLISSVVPIAGDYHLKTGIPLDSEVLRLKGSGSHADSEKEGLRVELSGGSVPLKKGGKKQKAIIEFLCDRDTDGTDTEKDDTPPSDEESESLSKRADEKDDDKEENGPPLKFLTYKDEKVGKDGEDWGVLRLSWRTKYACEDAINKPLPSKGSSWGFFTWFIIM